MPVRRRHLGRSFCFVFLMASVPLILDHSAVRAESEVKDDRAGRLLETYRKMLDEDPTAEYPYRRLLEVSHVRGGVKGLIKLYLGNLGKKQQRYARWMVLGHLYRTSDKDEEAQKAYAQAAEIGKRKAAPHVALAKLHRQQRRLNKALESFDRAIALARDKDAKQEVLKAAAETAMDGKDIQRAEKYFEALVKTAPGNLFLRMEFASNLARAGHKERALALWLDLKRRSKRELKNLVIVLREVAELQTALKRYDEAEKTWREGLERLSEGHWARSTFLEGLIGLHRRQDRLDELIEAWLPKTRTSYQTLVTVARLYEELANDKEALRLYQLAVKRRSRDSNARLRVIALLERVGKVDEVIDAYKALIKATRGEARHEIRLAELYFTRGRTKDGLAMLDSITRNYKSDPGVHQSVIDMLIRYGNRRSRSKIETAYKLLMKLEPREESHPISLGELYWSNGDRKKALATWRKLLKVARRKAEGYYLLAEVYANHNMGNEASEAFQEAIRLAPKNPRYRQAYALLLEKNRKFGPALKQWKRVLDDAGRRHILFTREARRRVIALWKREGRLELEISRLETEFKREPVDPAVGTFLGAVYLNLRRRSDAERVYSRVVKAYPSHVNALVGLESVYTRQNRPKEAIQILFRLAETNSKDASEYMHRAADLALSLGRQEQALECMRKVVELNPADPLAHTRVAELHQRMGSLHEAAEAWRQSLLLDPRNTRNQFRLATIYRELGNSIREEQVLADIVRTSTEPSDVLKAGRQLLSVAVTNDRVESLEEIVRPLVFNRRNRELYLRLLVDVYGALARSYAYDSPGSASEGRLRELGARALKPLLDGLLSSDVTLRNRALGVISLTRPPAVGNALARLIQSQDRELQFRSALLLGALRTDGAVRELRKLVSSSSRELRRLAVWSLGHIQTGESVSLLTDVLRTGSMDLRAYAALALGQMGDGVHRSVIEGVGLVSGASSTRLAAIWSLGRIASKESFPLLQKALGALQERMNRRRITKDMVHESALLTWAMGRTRPANLNTELLTEIWTKPRQHSALIGQCLRHERTAAEDKRLSWAYSSFVDASAMRFQHKQMRFVLDIPTCLPGDDSAMLKELGALEEELRTFIQTELLRGRGVTESLLRSFLGEGRRLALKPLLPHDSYLEGVEAFVSRLLRPSLNSIERLAGGLEGDINQELALLVLARLEPVSMEEQARWQTLAGDGLKHARLSVKRASAQLLVSLAPLKEPEKALRLAHELRRDDDSASDIALRAELARLWGRHMATERAPQIREFLMDESPTVRAAIIDSLRGRNISSIQPILRTMLNDPVASIRSSVASLLADR